MPFSDCFMEYHEKEIDEHLRLRRHIPEKDAEAFFASTATGTLSGILNGIQIPATGIPTPL